MQNNFQYEKIVFFSPKNLKSQKLVGKTSLHHLLWCHPSCFNLSCKFWIPTKRMLKISTTSETWSTGLGVAGSWTPLAHLTSSKWEKIFFLMIIFSKSRYIHITHNIQGLSEVFQCDWCKKPETQLDDKWIIN